MMLNKLNNDGYVVIKDVISRDDIDALRNVIANLMVEEQGVAMHSHVGTTLSFDINDYQDIRNILKGYDFNGIISQIIKGDFSYLYDSSIQVGPGFSGWHKDNRFCDRLNPEGQDWDDNFQIYRIGIYLQDHTKYGGGLLVKAGSHVRPFSNSMLNRLAKLPRFLKRAVYRIVMRQYGKSSFVKSAKGDIVMWSLRTTHAGHAVRLKGLGEVLLDPRLQRFVPLIFRRENPDERIAMFFTIGIQNQYLDRYMEYLNTRDYYKSRCEARNKAGFQNLEFCNIRPYVKR